MSEDEKKRGGNGKWKMEKKRGGNGKRNLEWKLPFNLYSVS